MKIRQANKIVKRIFKVTVLGPVSPFSPNWFKVNYQKKIVNVILKTRGMLLFVKFADMRHQVMLRED